MLEALAFAGPATWGHGPPWAGGGPWFLFVPLLWIGAIVAAVLLTRRAGLWGPRKGASGRWGSWTEQGGGPSGGGGGGGGERQSAEDILAERFARGEIDEAEYQEKLTTLRASR